MNLDSLETTPARIEYPKSLSTRSESPSLTARSSPSTRRRRSVSSMKGLMPLALSPSLSSSWSSNQSVVADDSVVDRLDDYLPELLARDLEMSADLFASRDTTAGAPSPRLSSDEKGRARASRMSLCSPYLAASARVQVLGAIEERESLVSFMDQEDHTMVDHHSDSASTMSHYSSEEAEPPSFRHRGSIVTTATSVGSIVCKRKSSPPPEGPYQCSWIDMDSDREEQDNATLDNCNAGSLSPRPPTPHSSELGSPVVATAPRADMSSIWTKPSRALHRKSHSVGECSPIMPPRRKQSVGVSLDLPLRSSSFAAAQPQLSMASARGGSLQTSGTRHHRRSQKTERTQSLRINTALNAFSTSHARNMALESSLVRELSPVSDDFPESDGEAMYSPLKKQANKENPVFVRPPSPPQPLRSVQSWLNSSLQPYPWASQTEDNARVVPLPPDAVETLRVSVACFPETMLLTSSLTVETIRSYAKKVRQPSLDSLSIMTGETSSPHSARKSLWRKVVTYKRGPQFSEPKTPPRPPSSRHGHSVSPLSSADVDTPKPWMSLKNVFGCCSDYICDALYAHIVAYNYISALVVRFPMPLSGHNRPNTMNTRDSQPQDDIPKKAASLLGLSAGGDMAASMGRFSKRLGSPLADWTREGMVTQRGTAPTAQDNALRVIQSGLLRCVSRLVATAKLMAENGTGEERMVDMETEDADMLFLRSLCEIVRMAEDSS